MEKLKSYGAISASRVNSSGTYLFGSDIKHHNYITLRISTADEDSDHVFCKQKLIEINMSSVQWADLLCNMNTQGVHCTLYNVIDKDVEKYHIQESKVEKVFRDGYQYLENSSTKGLLKSLKDKIANSKLSKKDKKELEIQIRLVDDNLKSNAKFYLERFVEESEKVVIDSKSEMEANKTYIMKELGEIKLSEIKALNDGKEI